MKRSFRRATWLVVAVASLTVVGACAKRPEPTRDGRAASSCACEPAGVVDPALLAFLSKARASHHEADLSEGAGDGAGAVRALERLVEGPSPYVGHAPEVAEVLADTRARLADLRSSAGDFEGARRDTEIGLQSAAEPSHFRGHLFEVAGIVEERRGKALKAKGDLAAAEGAFRLAIEAYERSIATQDEVIRRALGQAAHAAPARPAPRSGVEDAGR